MTKILLLGECMIELKDVSTQSNPNIAQQAFAGDVFNTAVYLKRLFPQIDVDMVTAVGKDKYSKEMLQVFNRESLGTSLVFESEDKIPGLYSIQVDVHGERSFTYWRSDSAARYVMNFMTADVMRQLSKSDIFFFSGISLGVINTEDRDKLWLLIHTLKEAGVTIAFDLNYRPKLWRDKAEAQDQFLKAFEAADILLPGVDDFASIFGVDTVQGVIKFFKDYSFQELIVKNGEQNVHCLSEHGHHIVDVTPVTDVVDTTSAGDSFNGGYLGARMTGKSIIKSVELANQVAGFVIQHSGAIVDEAAFSSQFQ